METPTAKINLYNLDFEALTELVQELDQPPYRARQIWDWLYKKFVHTFDEMTNLPAGLRKTLAEKATLTELQPRFIEKSQDGFTKKVLFSLQDGKLIETVLMRYDKRNTICVSSQAGCAMGCVFCATGQMGFQRLS